MLRKVTTLGVAVATLTFASPALAGEGMFVGFTEDLPKEIGAEAAGPAVDLGGSAFRVTLMWTPGQSQLTADQAGQLATATSTGLRTVLALYADAGAKAPQDAVAREQYCAFAADALTRFPSIRDVVVWNEPNKSLFWSPQAGAPAAYQALLARCWDALHAARPDVNVIGLALSSTGWDNAGSTSAGAFIRGVGDAYRASGRTAPIMDTVGHHPYGADSAERPWRKHIAAKPIGQGDWNKLMYNLWLAFDGTAQAIPGQGGVSIWYLEQGFQTAAVGGGYTGTENTPTLPEYAGGEPDSPAPSEASAAPDQHTQAWDSIRLAACQPYVGAFFNFLLFDEPRLEGWQSGPYRADRTPKDSLGGFRQAIAEAVAGAAPCDALKGGRPSADFMPPSAPTALAGQGLRDPLRVELSWQASTDDASAVSYRVYRNGAHVGTTSATSWTNVSVASGATYTYTVRGLDAAGNLGDASTAVSVTVPDATPPSAPSSLTATALTAPARVQLTWGASSDALGVVAYEVSRDGVVLGTVGSTAFTDTAVSGTTTYAYSVVALDAAGNRSAASTATVTTPDLTPPSAPAGLSGVASASGVDLAWGPASDDVGVTAYEVLRDGTVLATVTGTSFRDTAVQQGRSYNYAVRARDAAGNVGPQAGVNATVPDATAPSTPTGLTAQALSSPTRVRLTWAASSDNVGVAGYRVYRNGVLVGSTAGTSYTDSSVARRTTYRYTVAAYDGTGNASPQSASVSVTTRKN